MEYETSDLKLLFFETFSHIGTKDKNIDLIRFALPVILQEIRVVPLGTLVKANLLGGQRLGATLPTKLYLEFFVNDLLDIEAAVFQKLSNLEYEHNENILTIIDKEIPTDGLIITGFYDALTLAVYGRIIYKCVKRKLDASSICDLKEC
ncbi:unnamed protein product [Gordionus sp. m RMFG-2023]